MSGYEAVTKLQGKILEEYICESYAWKYCEIASEMMREHVKFYDRMDALKGPQVGGIQASDQIRCTAAKTDKELTANLYSQQTTVNYYD